MESSVGNAGKSLHFIIVILKQYIDIYETRYVKLIISLSVVKYLTKILLFI